MPPNICVLFNFYHITAQFYHIFKKTSTATFGMTIFEVNFSLYLHIITHGGVSIMKCSIADMRNKEVINLQDGTRLGFVGDVEIDTENAKLTTIIIYGRSRLFGLLGRTDDIMIPWENIDVIGDETILVNHTIYASPQRRKQSLWSQFFGG